MKLLLKDADQNYAGKSVDARCSTRRETGVIPDFLNLSVSRSPRLLGGCTNKSSVKLRFLATYLSLFQAPGKCQEHPSSLCGVCFKNFFTKSKKYKNPCTCCRSSKADSWCLGPAGSSPAKPEQYLFLLIQHHRVS